MLINIYFIFHVISFIYLIIILIDFFLDIHDYITRSKFKTKLTNYFMMSFVKQENPEYCKFVLTSIKLILHYFCTIFILIGFICFNKTE